MTLIQARVRRASGALVVLLLSGSAHADQCAVVPFDQVMRAQQYLQASRLVAERCEPCGEATDAPLVPRAVGFALTAPRPDIPNGWTLQLDGRPIDLAYFYISSDGVQFTNLAALAGCPTTGVAPRLMASPAPAPTNTFVRETASVPAAAAPAPTPTWRRPVGPVSFGLTSVLIAPGKSSGRPWDGLGALPPEVQQGLRTGLTADFARSILSTFVEGGSGVGAVSRFAPWAVNAINNAIAAPDVRVDVLLDNTRVWRAQTQMHSFTPSWATAGTTAYNVSPTSQIAIDAWDSDLFSHDHIGVCTIQGMPLVDRNGYARAQDFSCNGQLWGVRLRVMAASYEPVPDEQVPSSPPPSAAPSVAPAATPDAAPTPPAGSEGIRRGGAGESCTRTDDCTSPLRCVQQVCVEPAP